MSDALNTDYIIVAILRPASPDSDKFHLAGSWDGKPVIVKRPPVVVEKPSRVLLHHHAGVTTWLRKCISPKKTRYYAGMWDGMYVYVVPVEGEAAPGQATHTLRIRARDYWTRNGGKA